MTQSSVSAVSAPSAPTAIEPAPAALSQASTRAEFTTRLLAALAELRGATPPASTETPAPLALAVDGDFEEVETEALDDVEDPAVLELADGAGVSFVPLVFPDVERDPAGERGTPAPRDESASADDASQDGVEAPTLPLRFATFATQPTADARAGDAALSSAETLSQSDARNDAARATEAASDARDAERAVRESSATNPHSAAPEPSVDAALTRADAATPGAATSRSESAAAPGHRVLPELPPRNESEIVDQVRFLLNRKGGQARIELHPPQLGQVGLRISVSDHAVRLEITADRVQVAELLARHLPDLQSALAAQGLQIDRAQVDLREHGAGGRERGGDPGDPGTPRERGSDDDTSERQPSHARSFLPAYSLGAVDVHA
jgi:flagellar hook-length control protein FliK